MTIEQINDKYLAMTPCEHEQEQARLNAMYEALALIMLPCGKGQWIPGG